MKTKISHSSVPHLVGVEKLIVISGFHFFYRSQFLAVQFVDLPEIPGTQFFLHSCSELDQKVSDVQVCIINTAITGTVKAPGVQEEAEMRSQC